jgi:hypothetical protein
MELGTLCDEAKGIITGERQDSYGAPEFSFAIIADYWTTYLGLSGNDALKQLDVAHMMMLFKLARCQGQKPARDNYRDLIGYADIAANRCLEVE